MGLALEQDDYGVEPRSQAEVVPIPRRDIGVDTADSDVIRTVREYTDRGTRIATATKDSARQLYARARNQAVQGYSNVAGKMHDFGRRAQEYARQSRRERPLHVLGILATTAFAAGIVIRIWRSRTT